MGLAVPWIAEWAARKNSQYFGCLTTLSTTVPGLMLCLEPPSLAPFGKKRVVCLLISTTSVIRTGVSGYTFAYACLIWGISCCRTWLKLTLGHTVAKDYNVEQRLLGIY